MTSYKSNWYGTTGSQGWPAMPHISHKTLSWTTIITAVVGQMLLLKQPPLAIAILGVALVGALLDGWFFLIPLEQHWWAPVALGAIGLMMWHEPRGWFFLVWALIEAGTGLRASAMVRTYLEARAEEEARRRRLIDLGFQPGVPEDESDLEQ